MLTSIEEAIVGTLTARLTGIAARIAVQKGFSGLPQPAVYVSTEAGVFAKKGQASYRQTVTIWVDILFSHLADDGERRKGVHLILEQVLQILLLNDLGLAINPLEPKGWRNTTPEDYRQQGLLAFSLELTTHFTTTKQEDESVDDLLEIGLNYYLTPGDDVVDVADTVTLAGDGA